MNMLVKCGDAAGAVAYWDHLDATKSVALNPQIATTALLACAQVGPESLERGKSIHLRMDSSQAWQNPVYMSTVINMHYKCGDVGAALDLWRSFAQRYTAQPFINSSPLLDVVLAAALGACAMVEPPEDGIKIGKDIQHFAKASGMSPLNNLRLCNALMLMYRNVERVMLLYNYGATSDEQANSAKRTLLSCCPNSVCK
jgi:hypothetical protein